MKLPLIVWHDSWTWLFKHPREQLLKRISFAKMSRSNFCLGWW